MRRDMKKFRDPVFVELARIVAEEDVKFWQALIIAEISPKAPEWDYYHELLEEWFESDE